MTDYYRVSTDFLLGRNTQTDPRPDWLQPLIRKHCRLFMKHRCMYGTRVGLL
ncbi:MAG: hypothetical protein ACLU4U_02910 [[Clostridium] leptum]